MNNRKKRLQEFDLIPPFARLDHRRFLNADGKLAFLSSMSRSERRKLSRGAKLISSSYNQILQQLRESGAGFPIDQLLRAMAIEYTHRFAASGTEHLPVSFNYFEPFCEGKLIPKSVAPYMQILPETNHLFSSSDFFDYLTSSDSDAFDPEALLKLPDAQVYNFSANGDILELSFSDARSREYVFSGFSMVRRANSIHWCLVAGELLSQKEWELRASKAQVISLENVSPLKRAFLSKRIEEKGSSCGAPVILEGTRTAVKTVLSGEFDPIRKRHIGKSIFIESDNAFDVFCDDPEVLVPISNLAKRGEIINKAMERLGEADALWSIAEGLLQLPTYFESRVTIAKDVARSKAIPKGLKGKGGRGVKSKYVVVESVSVTDDEDSQIVRRVELPQYATETEGHWRRLKLGELGKDRDGNPINGKTWVQKSNPWRAENVRQNVIFVKDSLGVAKARVADLHKSAETKVQIDPNSDCNKGELYVLRCNLMQEEVYKVGWTSGSSADRAKQLSSATGVPLSFIVVGNWEYEDAEALETEVHAMLEPYRVNTQREFFRIDYKVLKRLIEQTITRISK